MVDKMMLAGKLFRDGQDNSGEVLDSNDLERERGITILSKNVGRTGALLHPLPCGGLGRAAQGAEGHQEPSAL